MSIRTKAYLETTSKQPIQFREVIIFLALIETNTEKNNSKLKDAWRQNITILTSTILPYLQVCTFIYTFVGAHLLGFKGFKMAQVECV